MIWYLVSINALACLLMLIDKQKAIKNRWRIPESTLLWCAVLGGSMGAIMGMRLFRHKTKHAKFYIGLPVILCVQIVIAIILSY